MGKWMWVLTWVSALALLTIWFDDELMQQINPNQEPISYRQGQVAEVKLKRNRQGHYVTSGFINDQPVIFLLDTGATNVSVPAHLANELGLNPGMSHRVMTANGTIAVAATTISQLEVGDIALQNVRANLNPGMQGDEILLGMSALGQMEFTHSGDWLYLTYRYK